MGINHRSRVTRLYRLVWPLCAWSATLPEPFRRPPHAQKAAEESCRIRDLIPGKQAQFLRRLRSEEHTSELQSQFHLECRLLIEKKKKKRNQMVIKKKKKKIFKKIIKRQK